MKKLIFILITTLFAFSLNSCQKETNTKPLLSIVSPDDNFSVYNNDSVEIVVNANDPDGLLESVDFYVDEQLVYQAKIAPYIYVMQSEDLESGHYDIKALATDNEGAISSELISVIVDTEAPVVKTLPASLVGTTLAILDGKIESMGKPDILYKGICWNKDGLPVIGVEGYNYSAIADTIRFNATLTNLELGTTYYYRAFGVGNDTIVYGEELSFTTPLSYYSETGTFIDERDSNEYRWVKIGNQTWMAENLRYEKYAYVSSAVFGQSYPREYFYNTNDDAVCPDGWHIPSDKEVTELINYMGGEEVAGGFLKSTDPTFWEAPNEGASNKSMFDARGVGKYGDFNGRSWYRIYNEKKVTVFLFNLVKESGFSPYEVGTLWLSSNSKSIGIGIGHVGYLWHAYSLR